MVYLDNAATTFPKPKLVLDSVNRAISYYGGNPGRGGHIFSMRASEKIYEVRRKVAEFFNSKTTNVIFTSNCTTSLNIAIKGCLTKGDHVILSCLEHNSSIRPVKKMFDNGLISYDIAHVYHNIESTIKSFEDLINDNTKAIICTHASNVTGTILPIYEIGKLCKSKDIIFIVDAAQTAGVIPIDMKEMNIDILCAAGHKGLYGITGTGILIANINLDTIIEGGTGSQSQLLTQPEEYPDKLESGTQNTAGILSIGAGIDFINTHKNVYIHEFYQCKKAYESLKNIPQIELPYMEYMFSKNTPVIAFNIKSIPSETVVKYLNENGFALRGGLHCSILAHTYYNTIEYGMVRFSPSIFTKETEINDFLKTIRNFIKKKPI